LAEKNLRDDEQVHATAVALLPSRTLLKLSMPPGIGVNCDRKGKQNTNEKPITIKES
jgi:hypothetical protein